jgi:hypothetical protein
MFYRRQLAVWLVVPLEVRFRPRSPYVVEKRFTWTGHGCALLLLCLESPVVTHYALPQS